MSHEKGVTRTFLMTLRSSLLYSGRIVARTCRAISLALKLYTLGSAVRIQTQIKIRSHIRLENKIIIKMY